jgi:hypothetical protein
MDCGNSCRRRSRICCSAIAPLVAEEDTMISTCPETVRTLRDIRLA